METCSGPGNGTRQEIASLPEQKRFYRPHHRQPLYAATRCLADQLGSLVGRLAEANSTDRIGENRRRRKAVASLRSLCGVIRIEELGELQEHPNGSGRGQSAGKPPKGGTFNDYPVREYGQAAGSAQPPKGVMK